MMDEKFRRQLVAHLVAMADANIELLMDSTDEGPIREVLDNFDLIFAVWREASEADEVGIMLLKAEPRQGMASTAFWCKNSNEAFWMAGQFIEPEGRG
jgi:hypothetical protein